MGILNYLYSNAAMLDHSSLAYAELPAQLTPTTDTDPVTAESFYYRKSTTNKECDRSVSPELYVQGSLDVTALAGDLWARSLTKMYDTALRTLAGTSTVLKLYAADKIAVSLYITSGTAYLATYNAAGTLISTITIGTFTNSQIQDNTNKLASLDIRIKVDAAFGYVQIYNYAGTLLLEYIGKTKEANVAVDSYRLYVPSLFANNNDAALAKVLFSILATEKTFGMYVTPLKLKAEGSLQQQDAGNTYANIAGRKIVPTEVGSLSMTVDVGQTKSYTAKIESFTDIALPANYVVRSVKVSEILECTQQQPTVVSPAILLKTNGSLVEHPVEGIVPNSNGASTGVWQTRSWLMHQNPVTLADWQVADFLDIEVGFKLTGA